MMASLSWGGCGLARRAAAQNNMHRGVPHSDIPSPIPPPSSSPPSSSLPPSSSSSSSSHIALAPSSYRGFGIVGGANGVDSA